MATIVRPHENKHNMTFLFFVQDADWKSRVPKNSKMWSHPKSFCHLAKIDRNNHQYNLRQQSHNRTWSIELRMGQRQLQQHRVLYEVHSPKRIALHLASALALESSGPSAGAGGGETCTSGTGTFGTTLDTTGTSTCSILTSVLGITGVTGLRNADLRVESTIT